VVGDTRSEAEEFIRKGIAMHIAGLREDGLPIPEPTTFAERIAVAA
jgi:predicted RNase H-like HicB family nuclease